jgi:hypothetical protein
MENPYNRLMEQASPNWYIIIIPNQLNGYGTLSVAIPGLQNGAPDGLALVDASNKVIQFLSYEGVLKQQWTTIGMTSTDMVLLKLAQKL